MREKILSGDIGNIGGSSEIRGGMRIVRREGEPTKISSVGSLVEEKPDETSTEVKPSLWEEEKRAFLFSFLSSHVQKLSNQGDIYEQATYLREAFELWLKDPRWEGQEAISLKFEDLMPVAKRELKVLRKEVVGKISGNPQERIEAERNRFEDMFQRGHLLAVLETAKKAEIPRRSMREEPSCDVSLVEPTAIEPYLLRVKGR